MQNKLIRLLLAVVAFGSLMLQLQAQEFREFAPIGAEWWYENPTFDTYIKSVGDWVVL